MYIRGVHKLGRAKPKHYAKTFKLAKYLGEAPSLVYPTQREWSPLVPDTSMFLNDSIGDCTIAGRAHHHVLRTGLAGSVQVPTDEQVRDDYIAVTGNEGAAYDPATGANDNGCALEDVLNYYRKLGQIGAFISFDPLNVDHFKFVIDAFEGAYCGVGLPKTIEGQSIWDVTDPSLAGDAAPNSEGGHCILPIDYLSDGTYRCKTWGMNQPFTQAWWNAYANPNTAAYGEAYAVISPEMVSGAKAAPSGFDIDQLDADLNAL